jgi:hypothetical protein
MGSRWLHQQEAPVTFDFSDLADSMGVATGWRALTQPGQADSCSCQCAQQDSRRAGHLVKENPEELFGTDEKTAPSVIGEL